MNLSTQSSGIKLPNKIYKQIVNHASKNAQLEVCGLVSTKDNQSFTCYPIRNIAEVPETHFEMHPAEQIKAMKSMRKSNETLFAIYHSHPNSAAYPSTTDIEECAYTDIYHLILSLEIPTSPQLKAYKIDNKGKVIPYELTII